MSVSTANKTMPKKRSKRYQQAAALVEEGKKYSLAEAASLLKKFPGVKFDERVTLSFRLGVDPRKADQMVRGTCPLPHGSGKDVKVVVFAQGEAAIAAKNAGADHVGYEDMVKKIREGFYDFDAAIATPEAMAEVRKLGKQLGPRGLMPNPKTGTVTEDTAAAVQAVKAGKIDFKVDRNANVAVPVANVTFEEGKISDNAEAVIKAVVGAKPPGAKGNYIHSITLAASMSPGIKLDPAAYVTA